MEGSEPLNVRFTENPLSIDTYETTHLQFRPLVFVKSEPFSYAPCWSFFPLSLIQNIYKYLLHEIHTHLSVYFGLWRITYFSREFNILVNKTHQYVSKIFQHMRELSHPRSSRLHIHVNLEVSEYMSKLRIEYLSTWQHSTRGIQRSDLVHDRHDRVKDCN